jgi:hypothetical protein
MALVYPQKTVAATSGNADTVGGVTPSANMLTLLALTYAQIRSALGVVAASEITDAPSTQQDDYNPTGWSTATIG